MKLLKSDIVTGRGVVDPGLYRVLKPFYSTYKTAGTLTGDVRDVYVCAGIFVLVIDSVSFITPSGMHYLTLDFLNKERVHTATFNAKFSLTDHAEALLQRIL